jgi:hypothetical protein
LGGWTHLREHDPAVGEAHLEGLVRQYPDVLHRPLHQQLIQPVPVHERVAEVEEEGRRRKHEGPVESGLAAGLPVDVLHLLELGLAAVEIRPNAQRLEVEGAGVQVLVRPQPLNV